MAKQKNKLLISGGSALLVGTLHWIGHEIAPSLIPELQGQIIFVGGVVTISTFTIAYIGMNMR